MAQLTKKREKMVAGSLSRRNNIIVNDIVLSREPPRLLKPEPDPQPV